MRRVVDEEVVPGVFRSRRTADLSVDGFRDAATAAAAEGWAETRAEAAAAASLRLSFLRRKSSMIREAKFLQG